MGRITRTVSTVGVLFALGAALCGPAAAQGETIYETQFRDPARAASEWEFPDDVTDVTEDGFTAALTPGALTVALDGAPNAWLSPEIRDLPADQAIEARIASSTGDESALFGVACRAALNSVGYVFLAGIDGYYTIGRLDGRGNAKAIVNASGSKRSDAIDPLGPNVVRGECVGKKRVTLTLFVNGEKVASTVDRSPPEKIGRRAYVVTEVANGEKTTTEFTGFAAHAL
ncbi:MAG TPA: hypothetical protein VFW06_00530 [Acidimicrobiia bacterium]|nr:hypothetical protein [Acidimicrobiia bacterium]